ncbi:uncharacterized protein LOC115217157 isoform X1 [Octopus sinensis]|uniref:Uncharacterized protein LOC115217157 isoform X1 n=1 Tax=Octopus sinensis TaxID=2607531 RepID=A0A6P7SWI4_9MOLL|nr:uncharacterized protein LOC115217157 isoform X1 [Octopus sinensis]
MKFHITFGYKKKVLDVLYPYIIRSMITRAFNLPSGNFSIQKWNDDWHDWVDVEPSDLQDGDRLNVIMNLSELSMGISPGAGNIMSQSPVTQATSPMVSNTSSLLTSSMVSCSNLMVNSPVVTNSSLMINSPMVTNSSLMSGFEEPVAASSNSLQDVVDTLMPDADKHEASSSTVSNSAKSSDVRNKLAHSEHMEFKPWPVPFRIPTHLFRPELKSTLASKQVLSRKMKSALIQAIYDEMINYTVYPTSSQYKEVAMAIITEYSHLRDTVPGGKGYESWSATLSDKFRNERRIMTNIEVVEKRKRRRVVSEPESSSSEVCEKPVAAQSSHRQTQDGLESWSTGQGISSLIESLEGCTSTATTTTALRIPTCEESPSFTSSYVKSPTPFKKAYVEPEHSDGILKSLSWLWRTNKLCDAVICSGETKIMLHRLILFAVSPHLLEKNIRDGAELEVNLPSGINDEALATFVAFLYDGVLNLTEYNYKDIERVANLLKVEKVQRYCREFSSSLAEYKLHLQLPITMPSLIENYSQEYAGKRKRGRPSKQTVILNLGDDHSLADRIDPNHYQHSADLTSYHNIALASPAASAMSRLHPGSDMPVVFPDSQEYCLPSTSQNAQIFTTPQGQVKTEPYQHSSEFNSSIQLSQKKQSTDQISSYLSQEGKSYENDLQDQSTEHINNNCSTTTVPSNNSDGDSGEDKQMNHSIHDNQSSQKNNERKSPNKSLSPELSKADLSSTEVLQQTSSPSPFPVTLVPTSGDAFSLYSLASN